MQRHLLDVIRFTLFEEIPLLTSNYSSDYL
jgi:hypothetical protein